jgi:hypothetical protein
VRVSKQAGVKCNSGKCTLALPMLVRSVEVMVDQQVVSKALLLAGFLPKKETRYKKVSQGIIIKSRRRTSFLSCNLDQPSLYIWVSLRRECIL